MALSDYKDGILNSLKLAQDGGDGVIDLLQPYATNADEWLASAQGISWKTPSGGTMDFDNSGGDIFFSIGVAGNLLGFKLWSGDAFGTAPSSAADIGINMLVSSVPRVQVGDIVRVVSAELGIGS